MGFIYQTYRWKIALIFFVLIFYGDNMPRKNDKAEQDDITIGRTIHALRLSMGLSRQQLGELIGVSHQQLAKYENGSNRIAPGRMIALGKALGKPVSYFFESVDEEIKPLPSLHRRMSIEVARNFLCIKNPVHQYAVNSLIRSLME